MDPDPLDELFAGARRDRLVTHRPDGVLNVFDPVIATQVEAINTEALCVTNPFLDVIKPRSSRVRVPWSEVRAALIERNRRLTEPRHVETLYERMRDFLLDHVDQEQDLTWLIGRAVAVALVPQIIDGLPEADARLLQADQEARVGKFLNPVPASARRRLTNFIRLQRATNAISREVRRRLNGEAPAREDFLQSLLPFAGKLGVRRISYLVTTMLLAASVAPEASACCLVYAIHQHPEWKSSIEREMAALMPNQLFSLPRQKLPLTLRFIKETARIWPFPFGTERIAACDIEVAGVNLRRGGRYAVSSYLTHHLEQFWENPETFDPDRWLSPRKPEARGTYVPFGFSPRSCVGAAVAHAQLVLICELFTRTFRVEIAKDASPHMTLRFIALPTGMVGTLRLASASSAQAAVQ